MTEKKKILMLCDHPLVPSGVGTQARYLIEGLLKTGPQIGMASRYNSWCLDALFGSGENIKQDKTLQGRPGQ